MNKVNKFISSLNISNKEPIVVAVSGGADSMMLLCLLHQKYNVICAHVNHKVRAVSDEEYEFVKNFCNKHNIIFEGTEITETTKENFEAFARNFRYKYFESILKKYHSRFLFTAHHGDDLMETILMRLVRGSSIKGYGGFKSIVDKKDYKIIRPLVYLTKEEIEKYNNDNYIPYVTDESNLEDHYTRNRYRHVILPFLKNEDQFVHNKFLSFSNTIYEVDNYLSKIVSEVKNKIYNDDVLDLKEFKLLDHLIQKLLLESIISELYPDNLYLVNSTHIENIFSIINNTCQNKVLKLPNKVIIIKEYDKLIFNQGEKEIESINIIFKDEYNFSIGLIKRVNESDDTSNYTIRLNSKDIKLPFHIITRRDGLKMVVKNMSGNKKINDIFIDQKIPKRKRDIWPILISDDNQVLWIPGLKKSNFDVVINGDYDIIITCEKRRNC